MTRHRFRSGPAPRLDQALTAANLGVTRSFGQRLIREGKVRVDGVLVMRPAHRLARPSWVEVLLAEPDESQIPPDPIPLKVIFENDEVLVVDKPAGLVVHPAPGHPRGTLLNAIAARPKDPGSPALPRGGLVHRLDKDTSGVLILAKTGIAQAELQAQFHNRTAAKTYDALVIGSPPTREGRIEWPIGRHPVDRKKMAVVAKGRTSVSIYRSLTSYAHHTHLEVYPLTGRTHQVRVHLANLGCPVLGDRLYGPARQIPDVGRPMLHARELKIRLPGETLPRGFHAPLPEDFLVVEQELGGGSR